jgi:enterochelin esterase-like enzyme
MNGKAMLETFMKKAVFILLFLLLNFSTFITAQENEGIPLCPSEAPICRVEAEWTQDDLIPHVGELVEGDGAFFVSEGELVFVYHQSDTDFSRVDAILPVVLSANSSQIPMQQVEDSDWWTLNLKFEGIDKVIMSFAVAEHGERGDSFHSISTLRGINAPTHPPRNERLEGSYSVVPFRSESLDERRDIHLYLPPNHDADVSYPVIYMADGQSLQYYAPIMDYLITEGEIVPLIVVGIASPEQRSEVNLRGEEYVHGRNPERYEQHRVFFNEEVPAWAETNYGASTEREDRTIFGISNGGLYAVAMNLHYPELYGTVFAFSAGASLGFEPLVIEGENLELPLRVYGAAGTLEPIFHEMTSGFIEAYSDAGADAVFFEQVAGHDGAMWEVELYNALLWRFSADLH